MVYYRTLASGGPTPIQQLTQIGDLEAQAPEGACLQAELQFDLPDWAIRGLAWSLDQALRLKGTTPCGESRLAWATEDGRTLVVRWRKGIAWWAVILGVIVTLLAVGAVVVLFWRVSQVLSLPSWVVYGAVGLLVLAPAGLRLLTEYYRARAEYAVAETALRGQPIPALPPPRVVGQPQWL